MIVKHTVQLGNSVIRTKAKAVTLPLQKETKQIIRNLIDSMRAGELVGMAAPQIGKSFRIFVTEIRPTKLRKKIGIKSDMLRVFINPKVIAVSKKEVSDWEGCGSVADKHLFGKVRRPDSITVRAINEFGEPFELKAQGLLARVIQHEIDHLNGVVFTDKGDTKTYMSQNEYLQMKQREAAGYGKR